MPDRAGQQLGNYQLLRLLGAGGFAEVYLGKHIHLGTQAAIKVLHTQLTSEDVDNFRTEARIIARLIHPHIVRVLEFGIEDKTPFLAMDYAQGGTLRQRHPKGSVLPLSLIIDYVEQVADALQYAHGEKLIHRDVKPENILLGRHNEILLSDFGIALVAQSSRLQSAQALAGTMAYMAPEQIQGMPRPASDQYALGIIVYEWLTGDRPFHGLLTELVGQHLSVVPPSLQEKVSTISSEVDRVLQTALAKDPRQRFESVQAFANALRDAAHHSSGVAKVNTPTSEFPTKASTIPPEPVSQPPPNWQTEVLEPPLANIKPAHLEPAIQIADVVSSSQMSVPVLHSSPQDPPGNVLPSSLPEPHRMPAQTKLQYIAPVLVLLILVLVGAGGLGIYLNNTNFSGKTWYSRNSRTSQDLLSIAWADSRFVTVGRNGTILTSPDGITWTPRTSGTSQNLFSVAWSVSQSVAVGQNGTVLTSPDGVTWIPRTSGTSQDLFSVARLGSQFVAVGTGGTVLTSPDGIIWTRHSSGISQDLWGISWSGSQFVVVGWNGTILTSPDGIIWTRRSSGTSQNLEGIARSGSQFVAVGDSGTVLASPDGLTWTSRSSGTPQNLYSIVRSGSQFVAVGGSGTILASPDGITWTTQATDTSQNFDDVASSGSQFVVVGSGGTILTSS